MADMTLGQHLLADMFPPDVYRPGQPIDKKTADQLFGELARRHPEKYRDISHKALLLGSDVARSTGGASFGIRHLMATPRALDRRNELRRRIAEILDTVPEKQQNQAIVKAIAEIQKDDPADVVKELEELGNPFALQLKGAGRGNPASVARLLASDLMYAGPDGKPIPIPVLRSYSQGLSPAEYVASTFGARKGVSESKLCCAKGTMVLMADGTVCPIQDVRVGDWVMGATKEGKTTPVRVTNVFDNGLRLVWRYRFRRASGTTFATLEATEDHKILSQIRDDNKNIHQAERWEIKQRPLSEAKVYRNPQKNKFCAIPTSGVEADYGTIHEPLAFLTGAMLGDGCMAPSTGGQFQISIGQDELVDVYKSEFAKFGVELSKGSGCSWTLKMPDEFRDSQFKARSVGGIRQAGLMCPTKARLEEIIGRKLAHQKALPFDIWSWDRDSQLQLLAGLFMTDGCASLASEEVHFGSTSKEMLEEVHRLLSLKFGVWPGKIGEVKKDRKRTLYQLHIKHAESQRRLAELLADRIPGEKGRNLRTLASRQLIQEKSLTWRIYNTELVGSIPTFDLEVDHPDHLFVLANGLIVSNSVASSGYLSKLLLGAAHRMVVTGNDAEDAIQAEAEQRGLPVETEDPDNVGAYLAKAIGPYKRNTPLTPKIMAHIKKLGHDEILVRSPITSSDPNGGIFAADVGIRERGQLPQVGEAVGIAAAGSLSEPLQQAGLSAKHSGGIAEDKSDELEGFELIEKLINPPKDFREAATHAELDGRISGISKAPQGGQYIKIGEKEHYVPEGRALRVQPGDIVEAGDQLTDGIANPRMVIYHKGLGEGARVLTNTLRDGIRNSGIRVHRRNLELITRGLVDRVRMTAEHDEYSPDDIVPYSQLAARWTPRPEAATRNLESVAGKYLESPVLHYTIGTRVTPSVVNKLKQYGIKQVMVHNDPPPFEPEATRGIDLLRTDPDWMTRQMGTGLTKGLLQGIHRGAEADEVSTSFAASRARAVDFGRKGFFQLKPPLPPPSDFDLTK